MRATVKMLLERVEGQEKKIRSIESDLSLMKRLIPDYLKLRKQGATE